MRISRGQDRHGPATWQETTVTRRVRCDCGWTFEGDEAELVAAVQSHGRSVHGMDVTAEQALAMAEPA